MISTAFLADPLDAPTRRRSPNSPRRTWRQIPHEHVPSQHVPSGPQEARVTWHNRVAWQEGMFLRAQHFQQQDRWMAGHLRASIAALRPFPWGFTHLAIARDMLGTGRFALAAASGLFN